MGVCIFHNINFHYVQFNYNDVNVSHVAFCRRNGVPNFVTNQFAYVAVCILLIKALITSDEEIYCCLFPQQTSSLVNVAIFFVFSFCMMLESK